MTPEQMALETAELERQGPKEIRLQLASHIMYFGGPDTERGRFASAWLKIKADEAAEVAASQRDEREKETLDIARKALAASVAANSEAALARASARRANHIAIAAIVFSAAIAISAAFIERGSLLPDKPQAAGQQR